DGKLQPRQLTAPRTIGDDWLVTAGLNPGDKVVMEGAMMLRPGMPVKAVPYNPNAKPAQPGAPVGAAQGQPAQGK
ncbi:MAG TPA: efflux transporter periplasmic adaptor subunit, partial [Sphingomonas sp.]|nr:efflux transporter periplasmic adaptor subunit [Sphingomonas sp.]